MLTEVLLAGAIALGALAVAILIHLLRVAR